MVNCLIQLREILHTLPSAEGKIAAFILEDPAKILEMPIEEIAARGQASTASVVRLSKRLGYSGYKDLCRALSVDLALQKVEKPYEEVMPGADLSAVISGSYHANLKLIENTLTICDMEEIQKAVDLMIKARRVDFYGAGGSGVVARYAAGQFLKLDKLSLFDEDAHRQALMAATLKPKDVAVLISCSGNTRTTLEIMRAAKETGATTVSLTKYGDSPLAALSDIRLFADTSANSLFQSRSANSRVGQFALIDVLFLAVGAQTFEQVQPHMEKMQSLLDRQQALPG